MPEFCEKLIFELEAFSYQNELESSKAVDVTSENVLYFNIWVSCLCTFNPSPLLLKWVMTLVKQHTETRTADSHAELPT